MSTLPGRKLPFFTHKIPARDAGRGSLFNSVILGIKLFVKQFEDDFELFIETCILLCV